MLTQRLCALALRAECLLVDFTLVFLVRMGLQAIGLGFAPVYPAIPNLPPLLQSSDIGTSGGSMVYGTMFFCLGLPELYTAAIWVVYAAISLSIYGQTVGMHMAGLVLVTADGAKPAAGQILLRHLLAPLSALYWLGYLMILVTPSTVALHDALTRTKVVAAEGEECRCR